VRNTFGRRITGAQAERLGGDPTKVYRLGLVVTGMGDHSAVDIANEVRREVLRSEGCLGADVDLLHRHPLPNGSIPEGAYIDDHFILYVCLKHAMNDPTGPDRDLLEASHRAYEKALLPRSPEKGHGFSDPAPRGAPHATGDVRTLGTAVKSEPGISEAPLQKRGDLMWLMLQLLKEAAVEAKLIQRAPALFVHPLTHRKPLMAAFHRCHRWSCSLVPGVASAWSWDAKEEILAAVMLLPLAVAHLRWDVLHASAPPTRPRQGEAPLPPLSHRNSCARFTDIAKSEDATLGLTGPPMTQT